MRLLSSLFLLLSFAGQIARADQPPKKLALLVGVSDYFDKSMEDLSFAENDVRDVGVALQQLGFQATVLRGKQSTRKNVQKALDGLLAKASGMESDGIVFLMFSGHGQQLRTTDGSQSNETPFFCPRDAVPFDSRTHSLRGKSDETIAEEMKLISLNRVIEQLDQRSNSRNNLLVVDACRNNPAKGKSAGITGSTAINLPQGISILFAAKSGQRSWESSDPKVAHGVMSHYLIEGLNGAAKNRRDDITWSRLVSYVREEVEYDAGRLAGGGDRLQSPHAIINDDQIVILNKLASLDTVLWNRFRGPGGSGVHPRANVPVKFGGADDANVRWKVQLPGRGASSPILWDDKIVVTAFTGFHDTPRQNWDYEKEEARSVDDLVRHVLCFDQTSGRKLWEKRIPVVAGLERVNGMNPRNDGYASSSPTADERGVYVSLGTSGIYAFDWNGDVRWKVKECTDASQVAVRSEPVAVGDAASLVMHKNWLIANDPFESTILCLNPDVGSTEWSQYVDGLSPFSTPLVTDDEQVIVVANSLESFELRSGTNLWDVAYSRDWFSAETPMAVGSELILLHSRDSLLIDVSKRSAPKVLTPPDFIAHLAMPISLDDSTLLFRKGIATVLDRKFSETSQFPYEARRRMAKYFSSPVATSSHIYKFGQDGACQVLSAKRPFEHVNESVLVEENPNFMATPALTDNAMFIRSDKYLYRIGF